MPSDLPCRRAQTTATIYMLVLHGCIYAAWEYAGPSAALPLLHQHHICPRRNCCERKRSTTLLQM